jgi:hypothetical protein
MDPDPMAVPMAVLGLHHLARRRSRLWRCPNSCNTGSAAVHTRTGAW